MKKSELKLSLSQIKPETILKDAAPTIGPRIKEMIIDHAVRGVSPVQGQGKFKKYKNTSKYPGKLKAKSPVNLILSGEMLEAISYAFDGKRLKIFQGGDLDIQTRSKAHNYGAPEINLARRPFLPLADGEGFNKTIWLETTRIFLTSLQKILRRLNNGGK